MAAAARSSLIGCARVRACSRLFFSPKATAIARIVKRAVAEILRGQRATDQDNGGALDLLGRELGADVGEGTPHDALVRPSRARHHGDGTIASVERRQLGDNRVDGLNGEVKHERRTGRGERMQPLGGRHRRGPPRHPGENDALGDLGHGELAAEQRRGGGEGRHARSQGIRNAATLESADLLGDGAEHGQIAGLKSRHVLSGGMGRHAFGFDVVERQRGGVDQSSPGRTIPQQVRRDDRAGIETDRALPEQVASADRNKIRGAWTSADEVHAHDRSSLTASAQVALPTAIRGTISRAVGPPPASAAASATEEIPISASTRSERVSARAPAALRSASAIRTRGTPSAAAAVATPCSSRLSSGTAMRSSACVAKPAHASAAPITAPMSSAEAPLRQPTPAMIMISPRPTGSSAAPDARLAWCPWVRRGRSRRELARRPALHGEPSAALRPGGRLVVNAVTVETEALLMVRHATLGGELTRVAIARVEPMGTTQAWRPALPMTQWVWEKS